MDDTTYCRDPSNDCIDLTYENTGNASNNAEKEASIKKEHSKRKSAADRKHHSTTSMFCNRQNSLHVKRDGHGTRIDISKDRKRKHEDEDEETERKRLMANTQERVRMRKINKALDDLRKILPKEFNLYHRRMSKIRTLRLAMNYIKSLSDLIIQDNLRRNAQYNATSGYMHPQYPDMPLTSTTSPEMDTRVPYSMSPMPFTTVIPFYPYLGPVCMGFNPSQSPYHTPEQIPVKRATNPRQLNFEPASNGDIPVPQPSCTDGVMETPVKSIRRDRCTGYTYNRHLHHKQADIRIKAETIISPLLGQRNATEHDSSFLSSTSDGPIDDRIEIVPLQTDGHIVPAGRTLAEILHDDEDV